MLDIRVIRENPDRVQEAAAQKGYQVDIRNLLDVDESRRELQQRADELRALWAEDTRWLPTMDAATRDDLYAHWHKAVQRSLDWA